MTVDLDTIVRVGGVTVAALVDRAVHGRGRRAVTLLGAKRPVAILVRRDAATMAFAADGAEIAPEDFERRYPGQRAAFERMAAGDAARS